MFFVFFLGRRDHFSPRHVRLLTPDPEGVRQGLRAGERTFASTSVRVWRRTRSHGSWRSFVRVNWKQKQNKKLFKRFSCSPKKVALVGFKKVQLKPDYKMDFFKDFSWFFSLKIIFLKKLVKRRFLLTLLFRNNFFANNICFEL